MSKVAFRTGITGKDRTYLAEYLLGKGFIVHGIKRRASLFNTTRIEHLYLDPYEERARLLLRHSDNSDSSSLIHLVKQTRANAIYIRSSSIASRP